MLFTKLLLRVIAARPAAGGQRVDCFCAEVEPALSLAAGGGAAALAQASLRLQVSTGSAEACAEARPAMLRLSLDRLHWLTSGATSLARGMNDAPKIVALLLAASALAGKSAVPAAPLFALVTLGMVAGSYWAGKRVTTLLAEKVTVMEHREGFAANAVTAALVTAGAVLGLPMSTTHVSSAGIMAAGSERGSLQRKTLRDILLAWVVTLPAAAVLGMVAYVIARALVS